MTDIIMPASIIGSGFAAKFHYDAIKRVYCTGVDIAGVYSPNGIRLNDFTSARKIRSFESLDALIDASEVLHVCTPPSTHEELAIKILQKGKHSIIGMQLLLLALLLRHTSHGRQIFLPQYQICFLKVQ